jgi:Protein of unknown function (DUF4231)
MPSRADDPTWDRLEDQIAWYDRKSIQRQKTYKRIKIIEIIAAAAIPFLSALAISQGAKSLSGQLLSGVAGGLGILITILEGVLQLNQYQQNWIAYRSTCEALRHEKFTYLAMAAPYKEAPDAHALLAERVEALVSQEHAKWASVQQQVNVKTGEGKG